MYDGLRSSPVELCLAVASPAVGLLLAVAVGTETSQAILQLPEVTDHHHIITITVTYTNIAV